MTGVQKIALSLGTNSELSNLSDVRFASMPRTETKIDRSLGQGIVLNQDYYIKVGNLWPEYCDLKLHVHGTQGNDLLRIHLSKPQEIVPGCFICLDKVFEVARPWTTSEPTMKAVLSISKPADFTFSKLEDVKYARALSQSGVADYFGIPAELRFVHNRAVVNCATLAKMKEQNLVEFDQDLKLRFSGKHITRGDVLDSFLAAYQNISNANKIK